MLAIPIQTPVIDKNGYITSVWITFLNSIINKYNPDITVKLSEKVTGNSYQLSAAESGYILDSLNCVDVVSIHLPEATVGLEYRITRGQNHNYAIRVYPYTGDAFSGSTVSKYYSLDEVGASAYIACLGEIGTVGIWQVMSSHGAFSFEA